MTTTDTTAIPESFLVGRAARLRGMLRMLVGHEHDAEDLLQSTYARFLADGPAGDAAHAERWLFRTARNLALNHLRGDRRRRLRERGHEFQGAEPMDPAVSVAQSEDVARIRDCLDGLALELREPLYLHVVEGMSLRQIAEQVEIGKSTVATRVEAGLIQLNRCFQGKRHARF